MSFQSYYSTNNSPYRNGNFQIGDKVQGEIILASMMPSVQLGKPTPPQAPVSPAKIIARIFSLDKNNNVKDIIVLFELENTNYQPGSQINLQMQADYYKISHLHLVQNNNSNIYNLFPTVKRLFKQ